MVDKIQFQESEFVKKVEATLYKNETERIEEVVKCIVEPKQEQFDVPEKEEVSQFVKLLENKFHFGKLKKEEKQLRKYMENVEKTQESSSLRKWADSKNLDFPLYAVYKYFKRTVMNSK